MLYPRFAEATPWIAAPPKIAGRAPANDTGRSDSFDPFQCSRRCAAIASFCATSVSRRLFTTDGFGFLFKVTLNPFWALCLPRYAAPARAAPTPYFIPLPMCPRNPRVFTPPG